MSDLDDYRAACFAGEERHFLAMHPSRGMEKAMKKLKFRSDLISGLLVNPGDTIRTTLEGYPVEQSIGKIFDVAQGYGVAATVSLRVLAYVVPVLRLARQLPSEQTSIQLYTATGGVLRANPSYDSAKIHRASALIRLLLEQYTITFHQALIKSRPSNWALCDWFNARDEDRVELSQDLAAAVEQLLPYAREVVSQDQTMARFIANRGGELALRYMVEHALYMRDPIRMHPAPCCRCMLPVLRPGFYNECCGDVIMVGGPSEKIFYKMRQGILERLGTHGRWRSHQFFTPVGDPPTYHPQTGEPYADVAVDQHKRLDLATVLAMAKTAGPGPLKDWIILLQDAAGVGRFTIAAHKQSAEETAVLERGLANLTDWLRALSLY